MRNGWRRSWPGSPSAPTSPRPGCSTRPGAALDLGPRGIRVNAVAPGPVQTGWMTGAPVEEVRRIVPLRRPGEPEDSAGAVGFLASHQARWLTGQGLQVAGGHAL